MNETFDPITLILIAAAVVVFFKLRGVLGQKTGHQEQFDPFEKSPDEATSTNRSKEADDNVITMPTNKQAKDRSHDDTGEDLPPKYSNLSEQIKKIRKLDENFDIEQFLTGAKAAYEMIVVGFAEADKAALKNLLSKEVFAGFAAAIDDRKKQGAEMTTQFIGIESTDISKIEMEGKRAIITVRFVAEMVSFVRDNKGNVIEGDENEIQEIRDVWSFERDLSSNDPNWLLVATDDE